MEGVAVAARDNVRNNFDGESFCAAGVCCCVRRNREAAVRGGDEGVLYADMNDFTESYALAS